MIIILATFAQALCGSGPAVGIIGVLIVWRFILGVGIGGDYPLSAVISSEFASTRIRGRMITATFAAQGWGNFSESNFFYSIIFGLGFIRLIAVVSLSRSRCDCRYHHRFRLQELHHQ